jgi:hypothetical protein
VSGRQNGKKGPRQQTTTISEEGENSREWHQRVELKTHVSVRIVKQKVGSYAASRKIKDWACRGVDPVRNG